MPTSVSMRLRLILVACFFFVSGATGLVYEVVWSRRLELTFGSTSYSIGVVLAAYMAGLGLGAWLLGRIADRPGSPANRYALLEAGIGVRGLLAPWVLDLVEVIYVGIGGFGGVFTKALLGLVAILPATVLMGGTLPVLARAFVRGRDETQRAVGLLYGINTVGAVCGAMVAGFSLIGWLGLDEASRWTGVVNLSLAVIVLLLRGRFAPMVRAEEATAGEPPPDSEAARKQRGQLALVLTFGVGAIALALEVAWTRAISLAAGTSGHAFTIMLAATLLGIGLGSLLVARRQPDERAPLRQVALALLLLGGANVGFLLTLDQLPSLFFVIAQPRYLHYHQLLMVTFGICAMVLLPATLAMGFAFPLSVQLGTPAGGQAGRSVGRLYLANTLGAIVGSLGGGFVLLPALGSDGVIRFGVALLGLGVVGLARLSRTCGGWSKRRCMTYAVLGTLLALCALPTWVPLWDSRRLDLDPLRFRPKGTPRQPGDYQRAFVRGGSIQLYAREGRNAFVTIRALPQGISLTLGGKADASNMGDMTTQILCGVLPFAAQPDAKRVLVVGAGSGVTARVAAEYESVERLDLVEIEEAIVEASSEFFRKENHGVFEFPNVNLVYEDARTHMLVNSETYDIIISEPTNPFISGVANLFTQEHYANVSAHLAPGGVHLQWVQTYDSDDWMLRAMLRTFRESFKYVDLWWASPGDLLLLGSEAPLDYERDVMDRLVRTNRGLGADLKMHLGRRKPEDLFARFLLHGDELATLVSSGAILSDRLPQLEGYAARTRYLGGGGVALSWEINQARVRRGNFWPRSLRASAGSDDALRVAAVRMGWAGQGDALQILRGVSSPEAVWLRALAGGSLAASRQAMLEALEGAPADGDLLLGLARAEQAGGNLEAMGELLDRLEAAGGNDDPHYYWLRALREQRSTEPGRTARVTAEVETALPLISSNLLDAELRGTLLWLLTQEEGPEGAALLERLYTDSPWDSQAGVALVDLSLRKGRHDLARQLIEQLFEQNGLGHKQEIRHRYLQALAAGSNPRLVSEVRRFLRDFPSTAAKPEMHDFIRLLRDAPGND